MSSSQSNASKEIERSRIEAIFKKLDTDQDGRIGIKDLTDALANLNLPSSADHAEKFLDKYDSNKDGVINLDEFVNYITEHEKALKLSFESLDHNNDGLIDAEEIVKTFKQMGINIQKEEALRMIKRMDKDDSLTINWNEWRDYLIMYPSAEICDIYTHWRHSVAMDTGEPAAVPDDYTEAELKSGAWWRHLLAGGVAGAVSRSCTAPFDRLKLTLMVYASQKNPITIVGGVREMIREGGVWSLWRGNGINVVKIAPETAIKFMAYEQIKRLMIRDSHREIGIMERFAAGSMAGAVSQTVIYPMEVLKTRLSLRKTGQYKGVYDCAKTIYKKEGARCFFKGYLTNLLGIIPYAGIDLAIYETLKQMYITRHGLSHEPGTMVLLGCGIFSSCSGAVASYPLALIRTKQQMSAHTNHGDLGLFGYFKYILKHDGPRGLYRGIAPNFLKVAPAMSISYVVYEHTRKVLGVGMT